MMIFGLAASGLLFLAASLVGPGAAVLETDLAAKYINHVREILYNPQDTKTFTANTCGFYDDGYDVKLTMFLPGNPEVDPNKGLVYFVVSTQADGDIQADDIICSVTPTSSYATWCQGKWPGGNQAYVHVQSNNKANINFALTLEFVPSTFSQEPVRYNAYTVPRTDDTPEDLEQVYMLDDTFELPYLNESIISLSVCQDSITGKQFALTSILLADDPAATSTMAQCICKAEPCSFDSPNTIGCNVLDLPFNVAKSATGSWKNLYIFSVAYGGVLQNNYPVGKFRFGAKITSTG